MENKQAIKRIELVIEEIEKRRESISNYKDLAQKERESVEKLQKEVIRIMLYESLTFYRIRKDIRKDYKYKFVSIYRKKKELWT